MELIPTFSEDLIKELELIYTEPTITPQDNLSSIMYRSGQRAVVKHLKFLLERTQAEALSNELKGGT